MPQYLPPLFNSTEDRSRMWRNFIESLRRYPLLGVGFCLWWTWIILIYQSTSVFPSMQLFNSELRVPSGIGPLSAIALTLVVIAIRYRKRRFVLKGRRYFVTIAVVMTAGGLLTSIWRIAGPDASLPSILLFGVSSLAIGCSSAFMYIEFNRAFGWLGMLKTLFFGIVSLLCSTCIIAALAVAPLAVLYLFFVVSPSLMAFLLYRTIRSQFPSKAYVEHGADAELYVPFKFITTSFVEGVSFGFMFGGLVVGGNLSLHPGTTMVGHLLTVGLLIASTFFFKLDFNRLIYQIGFPLMGLGFLLISCFPDTIAAGGIAQHIGYGFIDLVLWGLGSYLIKNAGLPAIWITACPSGALFTGLSLGTVFGAFVIQGFVDTGALQEFTSVYAFIVLLIALVLSNNKDLEHGWGTIRPGDGSAHESPLPRYCQYLSNEHGLTRRESEVLVPLAQGKSRKTIARELFVSENTVKTHTRNIYRKLFVQSQEELLELVQQTSILLDGEEPDSQAAGDAARATLPARAGRGPSHDRK